MGRFRFVVRLQVPFLRLFVVDVGALVGIDSDSDFTSVGARGLCQKASAQILQDGGFVKVVKLCHILDIHVFVLKGELLVFTDTPELLDYLAVFHHVGGLGSVRGVDLYHGQVGRFHLGCYPNILCIRDEDFGTDVNSGSVGHDSMKFVALEQKKD